MGWFEERPAEESIHDFFRDTGRVVTIAPAQKPGARGWYIHVTFESSAVVDEAVKRAGDFLGKERMRIDFAFLDKLRARTSDAPLDRKRYMPQNAKVEGGHTVWVGDLSLDVTEEKMRELFEEVGEVQMLHLSLNPLRNGKFGHVKFTDSASVERAVERYCGYDLYGMRMRIDYAADKPATAFRPRPDKAERGVRPLGCRTVFVGRLPEGITEERLREFFGTCGQINDLRFGKGSKFAHVEFYHEADADRAVDLNGARVDGSVIRVDFAVDRRDARADDGRPMPDEHGTTGWPPHMQPPFTMTFPPGFPPGYSANLPPGFPPGFSAAGFPPGPPAGSLPPPLHLPSRYSPRRGSRSRPRSSRKRRSTSSEPGGDASDAPHAHGGTSPSVSARRSMDSPVKEHRRSPSSTSSGGSRSSVSRSRRSRSRRSRSPRLAFYSTAAIPFGFAPMPGPTYPFAMAVPPFARPSTHGYLGYGAASFGFAAQPAYPPPPPAPHSGYSVPTPTKRRSHERWVPQAKKPGGGEADRRMGSAYA